MGVWMSTGLTFAVGVVMLLLGRANRRGDLSSIHWYHRRRVSEEDRLPFGRLMGLGMDLAGGSVVFYACLMTAAQLSGLDWLLLAGAAVMAMGLAAGIFVCVRAMIRYNGGIF